MSRHLLLVGGQRCGSTLLRELLDQHPGIAMAQPVRPEPKVFLSDDLTARGADWYRSAFFANAHDGQVLGDKSTSYMEDPAAPARAHAMLGEAAIVAILRDPIDRAVSNWRFSTDHGFETRPLPQALEESLDEVHDWDPAQSSVSPFAYVDRGCYDVQLPPWLEAFPDSSHVIFLAELVEDPQAVLSGLYERLSLDPAAADTCIPHQVNRSSTPRPSLDARLTSRLREHFAPHDEALERLLDRPIPWTAMTS